ncbi:MAG: hypothetical protein ACR2Q3_12340 [Woeseiaceae bacterium]
MFLSRCLCLAGATLLSVNALAEGYVIGIGADGDSADGRSLTAFGDFGVGEETWLSVTTSTAQTDGLVRRNETLLADVGVDHFFQPIGIRIGAAYWGNADILDSRDLRASIYVRGAPGSVSLDYQKRNFEFDLQTDFLRGRTAKFDANGIGASARLALGEKLNFRLGGMSYDYSRNLRLQPDIDVLSFLTASRLSTINSLIDSRINAGLEYSFGLRSLDVSVSQWQTAVDSSEVDSYSLGFLTPISDRVDMELRIAFDDSETFGNTTSFSVYLYYFGGT